MPVHDFGLSITVTVNAAGERVKTAHDLKLIPYFAWANRGKGEMIVWFSNVEENPN